MGSLSGGSNGSTDPVTLANKLLRLCNSSRRVRSLDDIRSTIILDLYVGFMAETPQGLVETPITQEDEIHNCQVIIDQLAANLHTSLSHIRGRGVIEGDPVVIQNLLEIISMLADIILNKIDSDISVDMDDTQLSDRFITSGDVSDELSSREVRWDAPKSSPSKYSVQERNGIKEYAQVREDSPPIVLSELDSGNGNSKKLIERSSNLLDRANNLLMRSRELNQTHFPTRDRSPPPPVVKENTWVSPGRLDSTDDLVREGQWVQQRLKDVCGPLQQKRTAELPSSTKPSMFDQIGVRPKVPTELSAGVVEQDKSVGRVPEHRTITHHLYHHYPSLHRDFSATAPLPRRSPTSEKDRFRSTVGAVGYDDKHRSNRLPTSTAATTTATTESSRPLAAKGLASSYTDLNNLVSETAAYVRAAVSTSPVRSKIAQDLMVDYPTSSRFTGAALTERRVPPTTMTEREDLRLAQDLNVGRSHPTTTRPGIRDAGLDYSQTSPGAGSRKVSFLEDRSYGSSDLSREKISKSRDSEEDVGTIRVDIQRKPRPRPSRAATLPMRAGEKYGSYTDLGYLSDTELENGKKDARIRKKFHKIINEKLGENNNASAVSRKTRGANKQVRFQGGKTRTSAADSVPTVAAVQKKPKKKVRGVLLDTRQHLLKENRTQKKKTQILKKMYEEDLDDLSEEFRDQMGRTRKDAKETCHDDIKVRVCAQEHKKCSKKENEFKKKISTKSKGASVPKKTEVTIKVVPSKKARMSKPTVASKVRKHSTGSRVAKRAMSVTDDDDLMPILLEEFPHLYLSEHTWHELWRRGINQIDQLTRTYAENKRKKSHAQVQVEEAEKRHDILVNLVKKQLEHSKRLEDIKDQRSQQAAVQNKMHEKRMQSARARKYYNEYQVRQRAKMLRRRTREEMIFKKLFDECLTIQKDRIQEVRKYAREQRVNHAEQRSNEIESMENYYKDQFSMLAERVAKERADMEVREKAQQKMLLGMKKDLRSRMEKEIKDFQEEMFRDEDDAYFRQLDADRLRHGLQLAKFQTRV